MSCQSSPAAAANTAVQAPQGTKTWRCRVPFLILHGLALLGLVSCSLTPPQVREPVLKSFGPLSTRQMAARLTTAATAWDTLASADPGGSAYKRAERRYEEAVSDVLMAYGLRQLPKNWQSGRVFANGRSQYALKFPPATTNREVSPAILDRIVLADGLLKPLKPIAEEEGLGVPVVGQIMRSPELAARYPLLPLNGANLTLTALIEFGPKPAAGAGGPRQATLRLFNPLAETQVQVADRHIKLAASYASSAEHALNDGYLRRFSLMGLLFPDRTLDHCHLYLLDPYDPKRIPIVFVHGLLSDPHVWRQTISAIYADPELRARYQPWYFLYPTALEVPYTANRLRQSLTTARKALDPDNNDPGMKQMVVVGHSMGGLLGRMLTIDSREDFWRAYFKSRPEELAVSAADRARLMTPLHFKKQPYVRRLIFIGTPHRGSKLADVNLIHYLSRIIQLPMESVQTTQALLTRQSDYLSPKIKERGTYSFISLGNLSPKHPFFEALNSQPIPVPHHSIIGRIGRRPLEHSSDGVVPYESSHLPTGTEKVVRHWHGCVQEKDVVEEVLLRLKQHLRELKS